MGLLDNPAGDLGGGRKTVASAGTRELLIGSNPVESCNWIIVQAESDNSGLIAVGGSSVVAAAGSQSAGVILAARESVTLPKSDTGRIYIDSTVSGDGVTYTIGVT